MKLGILIYSIPSLVYLVLVQIPRFVRQNFAAVFNCIVPHQYMSYAYILFEIPESQLSHFVSRF